MRHLQVSGMSWVVSSWLISMLMLNRSFADELLKGDGAECLRKAAAVHAADWALLKSCSGSGQMIWIGADKIATWASDLQFEISDKKLWYLMTTVNSEPLGFRDVDKVEIVSDGEAISNVAWSSRFRPHGCKIYVREDDHDGIFAASSGDRIDLRSEISPVFLRSRSEESFIAEDRNAVIESEDDDLCVMLVSFPDANQKYRYKFSPRWEGRLIRFEQFIGEELYRVYEYEWVTVDGVVLPKTITLEELAVGTGFSGFRTHVLSIDKLVPGSTGRQFLLSEANACEGARVIDHRADATSPVRSFSTQTNNAKTVSEEVSQMPVRRGDKMPASTLPVTPAKRSLGVILLWFNLIVLAVGGSVWLYRSRKKQN